MIDERIKKEWLLRCDLFTSARNWTWPDAMKKIPRPWDVGAKVVILETMPMFNLYVEAEVVSLMRRMILFKRPKKTTYIRRMNVFPKRDVSRDFFGVNDVLWKNIYEASASSDSILKMDFIKPSLPEKEEFQNKSVVEELNNLLERITQDIKSCVMTTGAQYQLLRETIRVFCFDKIVRVLYEYQGNKYVSWFNFGNSKVYIERAGV